jgi:hypothetical protein
MINIQCIKVMFFVLIYFAKISDLFLNSNIPYNLIFTTKLMIPPRF